MTSDRSDRKALPFDTAKEEIVCRAGSQLAPEAVDVFLAEETFMREMVAMKRRRETMQLAFERTHHDKH